MHLRNVVLAIFVISMVAFAQNPIAADSPFQVNYATNLTRGESYVNITNTGAVGASLLGPGFGGPRGNICVNAYAFTQDEQLITCCSCLVTPNGLRRLNVYTDLVANALTPGGVPLAVNAQNGGVVIKLVATRAGGSPTGSSTNCNNSAASLNAPGMEPTVGLVAWRTTVHNAAAIPQVAGGIDYNVTETPFVPATLSAEEIASISGRCAAIIGNGTGWGICGTCRLGALGGSRF